MGSLIVNLIIFFQKFPVFVARERVGQPLFTGILSIDSLVPIRKGQRELFIGG